MPVFPSHGGQFLVSFAADKAHNSLFPASDAVVEALGEAVGEGEVDIDLSLQHHSELAFDGEPSTLTAASKGTIRVSSDRPRDRVSTVIRIAGEMLKEPLAYPLVGRVLIQAATTDASDRTLTIPTSGLARTS